MELESQLLNYSLKQIEGVSALDEREHWKAGRTSLRQLAEAPEGAQAASGALRSIAALERQDWDFFLSSLPRSDLYRVAYSAPEHVMFLDVETTGLSSASSYLTMAGWLKDGRYGYWLRGTDPEEFLQAFESSPMIISFNGSRFDCRFLDDTFDTRDFSTKPNLDLMRMARGFGLKGGQKRIEDMVGFTRPRLVRGADGAEAVRCWRSFLAGRDDELERLLVYNRCDMYGMAAILDHLFFERIYGSTFPMVGNPRRFCDRKAASSAEVDLPDARAREGIRAALR